MSHVDEGTLHEYLDGELPPPERAAVDAHLAQCAACRASLAEARALVERASALLGAARPAERPAPPLEQLRRASQRTPWHVRTQFAWAASIALALGLGYLLRSPTREYSPPDAAQPSTSAPIEIATNRAVPAPKQEPPRPRTPAPTEQKSSVQERIGTSRAEQVPADALARARDKIAQEEAPTVRTRGVAATPAPTEQRGDSAANAARVRDSVFRQRLGASPVHLDAVVVTGNAAPAKAERDSAAPGQPRVFVDGARVQPSTAATWPVIDRQVAKSLLGEEPVGLPGLAVRAIRAVPGADRTVVVEQAIDLSSVVQVFQRPASTALSDSSSVSLKVRSARERPDNLLARYVGRLRVEIVGPLSLDSLNRLLEQVRPLP